MVIFKRVKMIDKRMAKRDILRTDEAIKTRRIANIPRITYPEALPITAKKNDIVEAIKRHRVVVITGETGSGKTTQIPKMCLEAGRGMTGVIGCTQPRRVAAITVAHRIAEELGEEVGRSVGYQIRFEDRSGKNNYIKIMTDGILLNEAQNDPYLRHYDTIIVDEAHERSLNIDFVLGILRMLLRKRKDLKVIITSATIDTEKFARAFHAPIIEVSGRMYPVAVRYMSFDHALEESGEMTYVDTAIAAVEKLIKEKQGGDFLIFMPTEQDIRETCDVLEGRLKTEATILPLYARLPWTDQRRVFQPSSSRKIIVATNVAETSITIPGIRYVIDTGLARMSQYNPRSRTTSLPIRAISKSSADQRKGRCGRVQNGICIRLFDAADYEGRSLFTEPEILRSNLAEVILRMLALNLGDISSFPFIDSPNRKNIKDGIDILKELGAIETGKKHEGVDSRFLGNDKTKAGNEQGQNRDHGGKIRTEAGKRADSLESAKKDYDTNDVVEYSLTKRGRMMARLPVDPRISRMIIEGEKENCVPEILIIASALTIQDPRERPMEYEAEADKAHVGFADSSSDFMTFLRIWKQYQGLMSAAKSKSRMKKFCREHYLSFRRMRDWIDVHDQLKSMMDEQGWKMKEKQAENDQSLRDGIHKSILAGYLSNMAMKKEKNIYTAAKGREVMLFPGSGLFNKGGTWIVAAEMVETSRLFARMAANINCEWLEQLGGSLCRSTYSEPHWSRDRGEVVAYEQVSLFGLVIVSKRSVSFGRIHPEEAHDIFIRSALVEGDVKKPFPFLIHNQAVIESILHMEDKIRRRNLLVSEEELARFYANKLSGISDVRTLQKVIREKGSDEFLRMKEQDILQHFPAEDEMALYPDEVVLDHHRFSCTYRFDPGKPDDGVTLRMPVHMISILSGKTSDWLIPGYLREKIMALLKSLPKDFKKKLQPLTHTCEVILQDMKEKDDVLLAAMGRTIHQKFGVHIPASSWSQDVVPDHLKVRFAVVDDTGMELASDRDMRTLHESIVSEKSSNAFLKAKDTWERTGFKEWTFGNLPEAIFLGNSAHPEGFAYPAIVSGDDCVNLRLFENPSEADIYHRKGVMKLYSIIFNEHLRYLKKAIVFAGELKQWAEDMGLTKTLEKTVYEKVVQDLFNRPFRTREAFLQHARDVASDILPAGQNVLNRYRPLIKAYHATVMILQGLQSGNRFNRPALQYLAEIQDDLKRLMPPDFLIIYGEDKISDVIRYLRAMTMRAERGLVHLEKAHEKTKEVKIYVDQLEDMVKNITFQTSEAKKAAVETFKWMIEEYKISVFAQEIKTAYPVSKKRMETKIQEISRMM